MKQFIEQIENHLSESVDCICSGGCGIFAYIACKVLREKGYLAKILFYQGHDGIDHITQCNDNKRKVKEPRIVIIPSHYVVECNGILFDGEGQYTRREAKDAQGYVTLSDLRTAIAKGHWNEMYNKEQNRRVYNIIKDASKFLNE